MSSQKPTGTPPIIGLTGAIGSGKSVAAKMLREQGCVVSDADATVRDLLSQPGIIDTLVRWWGAHVLAENGSLDRSAIASIVFADAKERLRLEQLLHPLVSQRREELFAKAPATTPALVIDAPLLMEVGLEDQCDVVLYIDSEPALCRQRVAGSRGWTDQEFDQRSEAQIPAAEKRARADVVVSNNGDLEALAVEIQRFVQRLTGGYHTN